MTGRAGGLDPAEDAWRRRGAELADSARASAWPDRVEARRISDLLFDEFGRPVPLDDVAVEEAVVGAGDSRRRARILLPAGSPAGTVVFVHGGGFAFGSIDEAANRSLAGWRAIRTPAAVMQVEYRLAPEYPFPAGLQDVVAAVDSLRERTDLPPQIVLDGVSAGANLALGAAVVLRDRGTPIDGLVLEIPSPDLRAEAPWLAEFADLNSLLDRAVVRDAYLGGTRADDPLASPAVGDLSGLPPTHVMTAEFDPLRAVGEALVDRLRADGVDVSASRRLGALHGSLTLTGRSRSARLWNDEAVAAIRDVLGQRP